MREGLVPEEQLPPRWALRFSAACRLVPVNGTAIASGADCRRRPEARAGAGPVEEEDLAVGAEELTPKWISDWIRAAGELKRRPCADLSAGFRRESRRGNSRGIPVD